MKNIILILNIIYCNCCYSQNISGVSQKERDSIILTIKEEKSEETIPGLLYLYDQLDSSVNILKIYNATGYDLYGFDYSQNLLDYIKFLPSYLIYSFNLDKHGKAKVLSSVQYAKFGIAIAPAMVWEQDTYGNLLDLVNIYNVSIFNIQGCQNPFVSIGRNLFISVDGKLLEANSYLKGQYTLSELANLFNPRY